jgi:hypothetical protein
LTLNLRFLDAFPNSKVIAIDRDKTTEKFAREISKTYNSTTISSTTSKNSGNPVLSTENTISKEGNRFMYLNGKFSQMTNLLKSIGYCVFVFIVFLSPLLGILLLVLLRRRLNLLIHFLLHLEEVGGSWEVAEM